MTVDLPPVSLETQSIPTQDFVQQGRDPPPHQTAESVENSTESNVVVSDYEVACYYYLLN